MPARITHDNWYGLDDEKQAGLNAAVEFTGLKASQIARMVIGKYLAEQGFIKPAKFVGYSENNNSTEAE